MANKIDIFNMALAHIGSTDTIADELELSPERVICSRFWDTCRDWLFAYKDMKWKFATNTVALADLGDPPPQWGFRYRYPNDCVNALEIVADNSILLQTSQKIPFEIGYEAAGRVIYTNQDDAILSYTKRIEEAERYPATFVAAIAYNLAAMIAMPLKKDGNLANDLLQKAEQFAQIAMAASLNEGEPGGPERSVYEQEIHA